MVWRALGFLLVLALVPAAARADRHPSECFGRLDRSNGDTLQTVRDNVGASRLGAHCVLFIPAVVQAVAGSNVAPTARVGSNWWRFTYGLEGRLDDDGNKELLAVGYLFGGDKALQPFVKGGVGVFFESEDQFGADDSVAALLGGGLDLQLTSCPPDKRCLGVVTLRLVQVEVVAVFADTHRYFPRVTAGLGVRIFE
jgi:hypothetical protein